MTKFGQRLDPLQYDEFRTYLGFLCFSVGFRGIFGLWPKKVIIFIYSLLVCTCILVHIYTNGCFYMPYSTEQRQYQSIIPFST